MADPLNKVVVSGPLGGLFDIDAADLGKAERDGYRLATDAELKEDAARKAYGGLAGMGKAGAAGAARGATLGLSDVALTETGLVDPATLEGLRKQNPITSGVSEAAGIIAPLALSGGAGTVGAAARMTPVSMVSRLAAGAERAGVAAVGEGTLARAAVRAGVGAAEGATYGAGLEVSEAAIQNRELTAEHMLASAGLGALVGGSFAASIPLLGAGARTLGKKAWNAGTGAAEKLGIETTADRAANSFAYDAAKGAGGGKRFNDAARRQFGDDYKQVIGKTLRDERIGVSGEPVEDILQKIDGRLEDYGQQIGETMERYSAIEPKMQPSRKAIVSKIKSEVIDPLKNSQIEEVRGMADKIMKKLPDSLRPYAETEKGLRAVKVGPWERIDLKELHALRRKGGGIDDLINWAKKTNDPALDNLKQARAIIEKELTDSAESIAAKVATDKEAARLALEEAQKKAQATAARAMETGKMGDSIKAAKAEQALRTATDTFENLKGAEAIGWKDLKQKFSTLSRAREMAEDAVSRKQTNRNFGMSDMQAGQVGAVTGAVGALMTGNVGALGATVTGLAGAAGLAGANKFLRERGSAYAAGWLDKIATRRAPQMAAEPSTLSAAQKYLGERDAYYGTQRLAAEHARLLGERDAARSAMSQAQQTADATATRALSTGKMGDSIAAAKARSTLQRVSADASEIEAAINRVASQTKVQHIVDTSATVQKQADAGVKRFFTRSSEAKRAFVPIIIEAAPAPAHGKEPDSIEAKYEKTIERHEAYGDAATAAERAAESLTDLADVAPEITMHTATVAQRAVDFLRAKRPASLTRPSDVYAHMDKPRISDTAMAKYLRYARVVDNPTDAVKDFAEGRLSREGAEALRMVYPQIHAAMERAVIDRLVKSKERLPYQSLLELSLLLNRPFHPSMEPEFIQATQSVYASTQRTPEGPRGASKPLKMTTRYDTTAQRIST